MTSGPRTAAAVTLLLALTACGESGNRDEPTHPSEAPAATATPTATAPLVGPGRPATLLAARVRGDRLTLLRRLTVTRVLVTGRERQGVQVQLTPRSAVRFAEVSRTAGANHGRMAVLTAGPRRRVLMRMKAPQPLTYSVFAFPERLEPPAARRLVNLITQSRG